MTHYQWIGSPEYRAYKAIERRLRASGTDRMAQALVVIAGLVLGR
jgi:hypothetical protein